MQMIMQNRFFVLVFSFVTLTVLVYAQNQSGFISLDCGLPEDSSYPDTETGITYISDASFIETGVSKSVLPEFQTNEQQQNWYVRSFPEGTRNCYRLNLTKGDKYLIRASFMYGNYDNQSIQPEFDLHLGPNLWRKVKLESLSTVLSVEIIHVLSSNYLHLCLVNTGAGTPFISAIELRPLKNTTYRTQTGSLETILRLDIGSTINGTIRYKDDVHDRIWQPANFNQWVQSRTLSTIDAGGSNDFQPPENAMRTAVTPENTNESLDFSLTPNEANSKIYVYMYFAEIEELQAGQSRELNISLNGRHWYGPFKPDYLHTKTVFSLSALSGGGQYNFSIHKTRNSTLPPIINAIEIYTLKELLQSETGEKDVDAITKIKSMYGLKRNWQGDPCAPRAYKWDGVNCSYNDSDPPRIISLNLSSSGLTGEIPPFLLNLSMIQYLDLSNNNLNGLVPDFLSQLPSLRVLNLEGNKLTGSVPVQLIERRNNNSLTLSVGGNPGLCSSVSCKEKKNNNNIIIPIVASVAAFFTLLTAILIILRILKRRKQQVKKVDAKSVTTYESLEQNNRQFTYSEVLKMTNNFEMVLGKGGFGTVYHGYLDNDEVAVKILSQSSVEWYKQFHAEVQLLLRVHHRNLTALIGYCDEGANMALVYEYMANGNLAKHLLDSSTDTLSWERRLRIAVEAAEGLEYLHHGCKPPIIHRDVKSTNILLNNNFQAKLADFGLSRTFPVEGDAHVSTTVSGTPGYLDPEYSISNRLTEKRDVYSFGVVLLEIITGQPVISKTNENENTHISQRVSFMLVKGEIRNVVDPRFKADFNINSVWKAVEIAIACVSPTSTTRPTMNQVVIELNECLATEIARRNQGHDIESKDHREMVTVNLHTESSPLAR